jgi:hypothetical protein
MRWRKHREHEGASNNEGGDRQDVDRGASCCAPNVFGQ